MLRTGGGIGLRSRTALGTQRLFQRVPVRWMERKGVGKVRLHEGTVRTFRLKYIPGGAEEKVNRLTATLKEQCAQAARPDKANSGDPKELGYGG